MEQAATIKQQKKNKNTRQKDSFSTSSSMNLRSHIADTNSVSYVRTAVRGCGRHGSKKHPSKDCRLMDNICNKCNKKSHTPTFVSHLVQTRHTRLRTSNLMLHQTIHILQVKLVRLSTGLPESNFQTQLHAYHDRLYIHMENIFV